MLKVWDCVCTGKTVLLQRGQRARKRPVWLANTVDPHLAEANPMNRPHQRPFSALRYNVRPSAPLHISRTCTSAISCLQKLHMFAKCLLVFECPLGRV